MVYLNRLMLRVQQRMGMDRSTSSMRPLLPLSFHESTRATCGWGEWRMWGEGCCEAWRGVRKGGGTAWGAAWRGQAYLVL